MSDHLDIYNFEEIEKSNKPIKNNDSNSNLIQEIETNIINKEPNETISSDNNNIGPNQKQKEPTTYSNLPKLCITNIITMIHVNKKLNPNKIALNCPNVKYNKHFKNVSVQLKDPKVTMIISRREEKGSKIICVGAKTLEDSERAFGYISNLLNLDINLDNMEVVNYSAVCDVKFPIKLMSLSFHINIGKSHHYEPELFPGLNWELTEPKCHVIIFASGKIVLTGTKNIEDIYTTLDQIYPILKKHKRNLFRVVHNNV